MPYLLMVLSSIVGITGSSAIKQYEKKHDSGRFLYLTILCFFSAMFFVIADRNGLSFTPKLILYGLISGAFYCSAYFLTFVAYASGSFALTNLIVSFSLVAPVFYGIFFLHDKLSIAGYF
ncbi:MAG: hypothetical protein KBT31_03235, partial [Firmicutes bacterium]|nr:hypothetical protein [Candidatus Colimorpha enterica]